MQELLLKETILYTVEGIIDIHLLLGLKERIPGILEGIPQGILEMNSK